MTKAHQAGGPSIKVVVADGQRLMAEALCRSLAEYPDLDVWPVWCTSGSAVIREARECKGDVALIDFWVPGLSGPAAAKAILNVSPRTKILLTTEYFIGPVQRREAQLSGALWILPKHLPLHEVVGAVRAAAAADDHRSVPPGAPDQGSGARIDRLRSLTPREIEVLQLLNGGADAADVSVEMAISAGTVKNYIHRILAKTGANTVIEASDMAERAGFISPAQEL